MVIYFAWAWFLDRNSRQCRNAKGCAILKASDALVIPLGNEHGGCKFALAALSVFIAAPKRQSKRRLGFHATDSQYRHHRSRGPRENHAGGRHAPSERRVPRQSDRHEARDGLERSRARARHHHPGEK